jgi:hypothetical protein
MGGNQTPGSQGLGAGGVQGLDEGTSARTRHCPPGSTNCVSGVSAAAVKSGTALVKPLNPWRELPESVRKDLIDPLNDTGRKSLSAGEFQKWVAKQQWRGTPPTINDRGAYAEWRFNHGLGLELDAKDHKKGTASYTYAVRVSLICVYLMMKNEKSGPDNMWKLVESIEWVGNTGNMLFEPSKHHLEVKKILEDRYNYANTVLARSPLRDNIWGVRSPHVGTALHFRGPGPNGGNIVEAHLDLNNPGTDWFKALEHRDKDEKRRNQTHTPAELIKGVKSRNCTVPPLK